MSPLPVTAPARVRRADLSDLDDLVALEQRAFDGDRLSRAQYRRHLDSDSAQVLVASNGRHDFFGSLVLFFRKRSRLARVYSLATRPESRGLGIGAALLERLIAACEARDFRHMIAVIGEPTNTASIRLHERFGFRHVGTFPGIAWKQQRWLDTVFMQRALGGGTSTGPGSA